LGYATVYFHLAYIQTEGITQGHAKGKVPSILDYTTINRRTNILDIKIKDDCSSSSSKEPKNNYIIIAIDSTGIKVTNRGLWIRDRWNIRKGYLKTQVAINLKSKKIFSLHITDEHVYDDSKVLPKLFDDIVKSKNITVGKIITDSAYDGNTVFKCLYQLAQMC